MRLDWIDNSDLGTRFDSRWQRKYYLFRRIFLSIMGLVFLIVAPSVVFLSMGYKYDVSSRTIQKTGALVIKTKPRNVSLSIDGVAHTGGSPFVLRYLLPRKYSVVISKEGCYDYTLPVIINSAQVEELDISLVPKIDALDKVSLDFEIERYFVLQHLLGIKLLVFSSDTVYQIDEQGKNVKPLAVFDSSTLKPQALKDYREIPAGVCVWDDRHVWFIGMEMFQSIKDGQPMRLLYTAEGEIKNVFYGLRDQYLVVHYDKKIIALDMKNQGACFSLLELKRDDADVHFDAAAKMLYVMDSDENGVKTLFKLKMTDLTNEQEAV